MSPASPPIRVDFVTVVRVQALTRPMLHRSICAEQRKAYSGLARNPAWAVHYPLLTTL